LNNPVVDIVKQYKTGVRVTAIMKGKKAVKKWLTKRVPYSKSALTPRRFYKRIAVVNV
jgi:hypothetical protein